MRSMLRISCLSRLDGRLAHSLRRRARLHEGTHLFDLG